MNWIEFRGVDSRGFDGLIICELPPISKPQMRTQITEIEGKDGDITEFMGYSAYDKIVKIGLAKECDIDEIIKYFSGAGEVIFSNEPDKFYRAEITEQIDFERLVKFKTANLKFHIQPFKYLAHEEPINLEITDEIELEVTNFGNEKSKPTIKLYGAGIVTISLNNHAVLEINIDDESVTIDSEMEEAYKGNVLKNRFMVGVFPTFEVGLNTITWVGNLTKIEVNPRSRWL